MDLNVVHLVGRVGMDPDVKYFESGAVKCRLTLAVNRPTRRTDEPDWFNLNLWGKTAQLAANYVRKGRQIGVIGRLEINQWQDYTTQAQRSSPIITVDRLEFLGSKRDEETQGMHSEF
ncbi:single-stranded DNA-binding protein [Roseofilum reptotaenium CS-1145]|uniref:Single-stranded DNA-binding protein n=1 Tax=Roseofilum reptotaenium AO1-A TaxID=1925591 RepID=A0A1L9QVN7_9CYAN|nr:MULTISPECIES: single-stranded DNA-binding protein [Roseofilum]MBP0029138.1 single-stranded DNA-binding protein [Roseofilum sp. Guam]MDB9520219.1 single-stranded DNA-binding protein [Roseofilum reptotaenium CS-1145]OJJ26738.1 single-stranded DNA-binding protein [Roseofilum reptotaenium AO1-A]